MENRFELPWPFDETPEKVRPLRTLGIAALLAGLVAVIIVLLKQPSHDRDWRPEIAVMPQIERVGSMIEIDQVRDWTYSADSPVTFGYGSRQYDTDDLVGAWLMVEPFGGSDAIAHTLVLFEFTGDRLLALTIEARKEEGEIYSAVEGALNTYELVYLWAEARDVLTRRARYLKHDLFVYPLALSTEDRRAFIGALADKTNQLYVKPRFYNTLFSNCTNELAKTAGLNWNAAFILTGYAPQHLWRTGIIPAAGAEDFDDLHARADMAKVIKELPDTTSVGFDRALLGTLRQRFQLSATGT